MKIKRFLTVAAVLTGIWYSHGLHTTVTTPFAIDKLQMSRERFMSLEEYYERFNILGNSRTGGNRTGGITPGVGDTVTPGVGDTVTPGVGDTVTPGVGAMVQLEKRNALPQARS